MRKVGPLTSIVAAGVGGQQVAYIVSPGRTAKLKKVMAYNGQPADIILELGTWDAVAAAWVRAMPRMRVVAGMPMTLEEDECAEFEWQTGLNIAARASAAAAAPADVEVQVEVEEIG